MRLLALCPSPLDGTAYWRVASPLARMRQQAPGTFDFTITAGCDTNTILAHDAVLLQRPFVNEHVAVAQAARALGRPLWCDWDDDILDVPPNNGRVFIYQEPQHKKNVIELARLADVVTVTTQVLARKFQAARGKLDGTIVVPNALDPTLTLPPPDTERLPVRTIAWRGGDSHNEDLSVIGDAFPRVAQDIEGRALWHFIGFNPYWLVPKFPPRAVTVHHWLGDVLSYFRFIGTLRPTILAVPLCDTAFNRAKSNISVIEAAWLGALPVAPKWLEGAELPGVVTYDKDSDFERALREAATMDSREIMMRVDRLRDAVAKHFSLDRVNLLRALICKRLVPPSVEPAEDQSNAETEHPREPAEVGSPGGSAEAPQ